jgi:tetratricopeptide (TPR) repeat protein
VAAPQFRPLDDKQQAEKPAASTDTPAAAAPQFRPLDDEQRAEKPAASTDMPAAAKAAQAAARNSEPVAVEPQQRGTQEQAAQEQAAQEAAPEQAAQEQAAQEQAAQEQTAPEQAAPAAQPQVATAMPRARPGPAVESPAVAEPQISAEDARLQQQLGQAREFYWSRDLRGAAAAYQSLGEAYPDNAEVWGEIGNFYFSLRRSEQAGAAYSHAIELLMQNNDPVRARQLLGVLFRLDARKARELETRLQQAGG